MLKHEEAGVLETSVDLGMIYANFEEGTYGGKIVKAGFVDKVNESTKVRKKEMLKVLRITVEFEDEENNQMHLNAEYVVSTSFSSTFIQQLKVLGVPFGHGNVDVSRLLGTPVVAEVKNRTGALGYVYSNIEFLYPEPQGTGDEQQSETTFMNETTVANQSKELSEHEEVDSE